MVCRMKSRQVTITIFSTSDMYVFLSIPEIEKKNFIQVEITYFHSNVYGSKPLSKTVLSSNPVSLKVWMCFLSH
jgi:hypothetical protein